jgi:MoxR-like ATPase
MKRAFVGKDEVIDVMALCLVAGENLFLLGPPGTAKSALVQDLARRLGGRTFDYLLTRFTEPNELFGPFDIRRLREGELVTNTEGMLPEAELIFLDELLNANSAILNSLLSVLNERVFRRGREARALPSLMVVGASNRLPEDEALGALFDRFLLRVRCDNVADERLGEVLEAGWALENAQRRRNGAKAPSDNASRPLAPASSSLARREEGVWSPQVTDEQRSQRRRGQARGQSHCSTSPENEDDWVDEVRSLQAQVESVDLGEVRLPYAALVQRLRSAGIPISDRRAVKLQRLIAASALVCGRGAARRSDLWVVRHVWDTEEQVEVLAAQVGEVLDAESRDGDHPRAQGRHLPDPEALARDLDTLSERIAFGDAKEQARSRDRLGVLATRCQWVANESQRGELERVVAALWERLRASE